MDIILNWLWQGCVVALLLAATLRVLNRSVASVRFAVGWLAMLLVLALPLLTAGEGVGPRVTADTIHRAGPMIVVPSAWWSSNELVLAAWGLWIAVYAVRVATDLFRLQRAKRHSAPFPATAESGLRHWRQVGPHGRRATLVVSDAVRAAAVLPGRSPRIAVAPALIERLNVDNLDRVVVHEWSHVQRRDDVTGGLQLVVQMIAGWHPAIWWIDRRLRTERELACDEMTVSVTGSGKRYAACLVELAGLPLLTRQLLPGPGALSSPGFRVRIQRLVSPRALVSRATSRAAAGLAMVVLAALSMTVGQVQLVERAIASTSVDALATLIAEGPFTSAETQPPAPGVPSVTFGDGAQGESRTSRSTRHPIARADAAVQNQVPAMAAESDAPHLHRTAEVRDRVENGAADPPMTHGAEALPARSLPVTAAASPPATPPQVRAGWSAAADAGTAIGRTSKDAGLATAGVFTRLGKRIAAGF